MVKSRGIKKSMDERIFKLITVVIVILFSLACLLPFLRVISEAFSSDVYVASGEIVLWPKGFTLKHIQFILDTYQFSRGMYLSLVSTIVFTLVAMLLTCTLAYPLSRSYLPKGRALMFFVIFTMLFNGGIVPTYLVVKQLNLLDTFWALIIPQAISQFNVIVLVNAFRGVPKEMEESAAIEGAGQFTILTRIMIPLCKPTLTALLLFYAVGRWNSWFDVVMYINDRSLFTLPVIIRDIMQQGLTTLNYSISSPPPTMAVQSAAVIFSIFPIILLYPFLQKYFVKGMTLGGVKG